MRRSEAGDCVVRCSQKKSPSEEVIKEYVRTISKFNYSDLKS
jgi:hypothetical protein